MASSIRVRASSDIRPAAPAIPPPAAAEDEDEAEAEAAICLTMEGFFLRIPTTFFRAAGSILVGSSWVGSVGIVEDEAAAAPPLLPPPLPPPLPNMDLCASCSSRRSSPESPASCSLAISIISGWSAIISNCRAACWIWASDMVPPPIMRGLLFMALRIC